MKVKYHSLTYASFLRILPPRLRRLDFGGFERRVHRPRRLRQFPQRVPPNAHPVKRARDGSVGRLAFLAVFLRFAFARIADPTHRLGVPLREVRQDGRARARVAGDAQRLGDGGVAFALGVLPQSSANVASCTSTCTPRAAAASRREGRQSPL